MRPTVTAGGLKNLPLPYRLPRKSLPKQNTLKNNEDRENNLKGNKLIDLKIMHYYITVKNISVFYHGLPKKK